MERVTPIEADAAMKFESTRIETMHYALFVLRKRRALALNLGITTFLLVLFFSYLITPTWKGTATILVERSSKQSLSLFPDVNAPVGGANAPDNVNLAEVLTGTTIAYAVVREFHLGERLRKRRLEPDDLRGQIKRVIVQVVMSPVTFLQLIGVLEKGEKNWTDEAADDFLDDWEDIEAVEGSSAIEMEINGETPQLATDIPNRMVELLVARTQSFTREGAKASHGFGESQVRNAEQNLAEAEAKLTKFRKKSSIILVAEEKKLKTDSLHEYESAFLDTVKQRKETEAQLGAIQAQLGEQAEKIIRSTVRGRDPVINDLETNLAMLESKLASLLIEKTEEHPEAAAVIAAIQTQKESLRAAIERTVLSETESTNPIHEDLMRRLVSLRTDNLALAAREEALRKLIGAARSELLELPEKEAELTRLEKRLEIATSVYHSLQSRIAELEIEAQSANNEYNIRILDAAYVSKDADPDWPIWPLNMVVGIFLAVVLGVGMCFLVEYWNSSIVNQLDIERQLSMPFLGSVPDASRLH